MIGQRIGHYRLTGRLGEVLPPSTVAGMYLEF
jgi:hypothetical protein